MVPPGEMSNVVSRVGPHNSVPKADFDSESWLNEHYIFQQKSKQLQIDIQYVSLTWLLSTRAN